MAPVSTTISGLGPRALSYGTTSYPISVGATIGIVAGIFAAIIVIMCLLSAKARANRMRRFEEARYYAQGGGWQQPEKQGDSAFKDPPPAYPAVAHCREQIQGRRSEDERLSHWHGQHYGHRHSLPSRDFPQAASHNHGTTGADGTTPPYNRHDHRGPSL